MIENSKGLNLGQNLNSNLGPQKGAEMQPSVSGHGGRLCPETLEKKEFQEIQVQTQILNLDLIRGRAAGWEALLAKQHRLPGLEDWLQ